MNKKIIYISDFFLEDISGGAELNDDELLSLLSENECCIHKIRSHKVTEEFLRQEKNSFFIISNFVNLTFNCKKYARNNLRYVIYEHDHKYLEKRNPVIFRDFQSDPSDIRNFKFYKNALKVLCQSQFHFNILKKNLNINNLLNLSGNLWSLKTLEKIRELSRLNKKDVVSILDSQILHKNTLGAVNHCNKKNIEFELIKSPHYSVFLDRLSKNKKFLFLPKTPETLSRVVVEARMLGCTVMTNSLVGAVEEKWFKLKGEDLIDFMINKRQEICNTILDIMKIDKKESKKPLVSIITTFYDADDFINGFMTNITEQEMFEDCELIIVDADSQKSEREVIKTFTSKYDNIKYIRLNEKLLPTPCLNRAIMDSKSEYVTFAFVDDVKSKDCIKKLYNLINENENISLVYGDVYVCEEKNQKFDNFSPGDELFSHSMFPFSKSNMIKCLPGPMPLWRVDMHEKCGFFNQKDCNYADDWEMWLRAVDQGLVFKKLEETIGLYYSGGRSLSQDPEQRKEEAKIFFKYSSMFGENYHKFKNYFQQFL